MNLIRVSRASFLSKTFDVNEDELIAKLTGEELEAAIAELPTEEEKEFMKIFRSSAPELERMKRKMSVCLDAEVLELEEDRVVYEYAGKKFEILSPKNVFKISQMLDRGISEAFSEMCVQGCVSVDGNPLTDVKNKCPIGVDEFQLLVLITRKFFFQIYLA